MQDTLPPLLAMDVMSTFLRLTGEAEVDLRPVKGATMLAWARAARLTAATAEVEIIEVAIVSSCWVHTQSDLIEWILCFYLTLYMQFCPCFWLANIRFFIQGSQFNLIQFWWNLTVGSHEPWLFILLTTYWRIVNGLLSYPLGPIFACHLINLIICMWQCNETQPFVRKKMRIILHEWNYKNTHVKIWKLFIYLRTHKDMRNFMHIVVGLFTTF